MLNKFYIWWVVRKYVYAGLIWGDATSYHDVLGPCCGYPSMCKKLEKWQDKYEKLGFIPLEKDIWISAGGYGKPFKHLLFKKG